MIFKTIIYFLSQPHPSPPQKGDSGEGKSHRVERKKCMFYFSKKRSQNVVGKITYSPKVPLLEKRTQLFSALIPLFSANKGTRENGKWAALLLRGLSKNKGLMKKRTNTADFVHSTSIFSPQEQIFTPHPAVLFVANNIFTSYQFISNHP